jgi:hypothetical protein
MPVFFILNGLFFLSIGVFNLKAHDLIRYVLLIGITFINKFYKFSAKEYPPDDKNFTVMSYNVRLFNLLNG